MKLNGLEPNEDSYRSRKHVGRGTSSGYGKTAGRDRKGQLVRTGGKTRLGSEGGQVPLLRRMPKRGFKNINRKEYVIINLNDLDRFNDGNEVTIDMLRPSGLVKKEPVGVKSLANGGLKVKPTVKVNKVSETAKKAVEAADGTVGVI